MTTNTSIPDHLTLESVKQAFDHWRNNRKYYNQKIPTSLCQQVVQLVPHYQQSQILKTLGLNHAQLRRLMDSFSATHSTPVPTPKPASPVQPTPAFVKAFLPPPTAEQTYQVEWQRSDGAQLIIKNLDSAGLTTLIQQWKS
jgi:hypothetical protein